MVVRVFVALVPIRPWKRPHRTASVTVVHAERDGLSAALAPVFADAGGPVTVRTESSAHRDGGPRWRTTIQVDRAAVGPVVERLQASPRRSSSTSTSPSPEPERTRRSNTVLRSVSR